MKKILITGATGSLGRPLVQELYNKGYKLRILVRNKNQALDFNQFTDDIVIGEVTKPDSIHGITKNIQAVFSTIGITHQKDGFTYEDVDYQGNKNILFEALKYGTTHFVYIASLKGPEMRHLKMIDAKERFVDALLNSPIRYTIVRPNGFFTDLNEVLKMAKKGRVVLPGDGSRRVNPIDPTDLAKIVVELFENEITEANIGGPEIITQKEIAEIAFHLLSKKPRFIFIPESVLKVVSKTARFISPLSIYGPLEFFLTVASTDMITEKYGKKTVEEYFTKLLAET